MKKFIRILSLLLSLVILTSACLISCKKEEEAVETTDTSIANDEPAKEDVAPVIMAQGGVFNFTIVLPQDIDAVVQESVTNLGSAITKRTGATDVQAKTAVVSSYNADEKEILIGNTGYPESKQVMDSLGYGEWTIRFVGNKLVVAGFSSVNIGEAVVGLIDALKEYVDKQKTVSFPGDMNVTRVEDEVVNALPKYVSNSYPKTALEGQGTSLAVFSNTNKDEFSAYLSKLGENGYTSYTTNDIGENSFVTYSNDNYLIHAGYYAYESAARITIENKGALIGLESDNSYTANPNVVTSLAQIGIGEDNDSAIGMSYCYQLADGSFLVIDGGYEKNAKPLYDYMKAKAPNGDVVIAAWLLTHNDNDHYKCFVQFCEDYGSSVKVERFIHNLPDATTYSNGVGEDSALLGAGTLADCKVIKLHTGYKLYIRNAVVEILSTIDNLLPDTIDIFNNTSVVFTVDVEGERALFMGDAGDEVAKIMIDMYGDYVKSDILQLSHHGRRNGHGTNMPSTNALYALVRPEIVLWPSSNTEYLRTDLSDAELQRFHSWNLKALESARECYIAGGSITVLELPYSLYSAYIFDTETVGDPVRADKTSATNAIKYLLSSGESNMNSAEW